MADQKKYLSEDEMGFGADSAAQKPKYLSESDMGFAEPGGFVASAKQSIGSAIKGAGQAVADFIPGVGQDNAVKQYGQSIIDANPTAVHSLGDIADKPGTALKEATGNAAGSMGAMLGARLLGQGITAAAPFTGPLAPVTAAVGQGVSWLGPAAAAALPSFGGIRDQQIKDDPSKADDLGAKARAAAGAAAVGAIETKFGPQEWALSALSKTGRDKLAEKFAAKTLAGSVGKGIAHGAATEGAEELVQNPIEQMAAYQDPTAAENLKDTAFSGAMGALGGGVLGGGFGGVSRAVGGEQQQHPAAAPAESTQPANPSLETSRQAYADQLHTLQQQEAGEPDVPQSSPPDPWAFQARQLAPQRAEMGPDDEILQSIGAAEPPHRALGIDPNAGPLSAGAAIAVDSGASPVVAPELSQPAAPRGSFGQMDELAQLVGQERTDQQQRIDSAQQAQQAARQAADEYANARLDEIDQTIADNRQRQTEAARVELLHGLLADPRTENPAYRFRAELARQGYRDTALTPREEAVIQRHGEISDAFKQWTAGPTEGFRRMAGAEDLASLVGQERADAAQRRAALPRQVEPQNAAPARDKVQEARSLIAGGARLQGRSVVSPAGKVLMKNLSVPQRMALKSLAAQEAAPAPATAEALGPEQRWAGLSTEEKTAAAQRAGVAPVIARNLPGAKWKSLNAALQAKLAGAMESAPAETPAATAIDAAAHSAATSPHNDLAPPTEAQAKAGNYKKGHVSIGGLDVAIENPEGSMRSGTDPDGKPWSVTMGAHYGYVKRTTGADGDQVDVYIGKADPVQSPVFVVDQYDRQTGKFDEHKAILGASTQEEAQSLYDAHFSDGKGAERRGVVTRMSFDAFKEWAKNGNTQAPLGQSKAAPNTLTKEAQHGATGPDSAGVAAGRDSQGSVDARGVVDPGVDGRGRTAGVEESNAAAEPAASLPSAGAAAGRSKVKRRGGVVVTDERLPRHAESLAAMAQDAGWQEQGGRMIRDGNGNVTGRTKWLPRAEWFQSGMQTDPQALAESVRKALSGEVISSKDQRTISSMMDYLDAQEQGRPLDEDSSAAEWERVGYNEASAQEQAAFDAIDEFLDATPLKEADAMRALGFTEDEIRAEIEAANRQGSTGETQAGRAQERAADDRAGARNQDGPDLLQSYSEQDLAARDEAQRLDEERRAREEKAADNKARADAERDSFALTGSDRPADVLAARGQEGLFDQPSPAANQEPIKNEIPAAARASSESAPANQEAIKKPEPASPLESIFAALDSPSTRKANKGRRAASKHAQADRIDYVQANFHDLLIQAMDAGNLEVNGASSLTEDNKTCL